MKLRNENQVDDITVSLSRRENEVLEHVIKGLTNKEISIELYIAENTVKKHVQNILKKAECKDRKMLMNKYASDKKIHKYELGE